MSNMIHNGLAAFLVAIGTAAYAAPAAQDVEKRVNEPLARRTLEEKPVRTEDVVEWVDPFIGTGGNGPKEATCKTTEKKRVKLFLSVAKENAAPATQATTP